MLFFTHRTSCSQKRPIANDIVGNYWALLSVEYTKETKSTLNESNSMEVLKLRQKGKTSQSTDKCHDNAVSFWAKPYNSFLAAFAHTFSRTYRFSAILSRRNTLGPLLLHQTSNSLNRHTHTHECNQNLLKKSQRHRTLLYTPCLIAIFIY